MSNNMAGLYPAPDRRTRRARQYGHRVVDIGDERDEISDEELTALALAADPDAALPDDAVPLPGLGAVDDGLLPTWYMPAPSTGGPRHHAPWQRKVAYTLIGAFLAIDAAGLCSTYGWITL
jgi:hypothetical protein